MSISGAALRVDESSTVDADACALAALLSTDLGTALLQGNMKVLMALNETVEAVPHANGGAVAARWPPPSNSQTEAGQKSQAMPPLQSPPSHEASPVRGAPSTRAEAKAPDADAAATVATGAAVAPAAVPAVAIAAPPTLPEREPPSLRPAAPRRTCPRTWR